MVIIMGDIDTRSKHTRHGGTITVLLRFRPTLLVLDPCLRGMGAPKGNVHALWKAAEPRRGLPERSRSPPRVHIMPATMLSVACYSTRSDLFGGLRRILAQRKHV